jgi:hypothetical protein
MKCETHTGPWILRVEAASPYLTPSQECEKAAGSLLPEQMARVWLGGISFIC